ncbi:translocation/assembly module TamB domain-containing protein [Rickettsiaceae bacterium]|nr:translocation/assembly module TamB domain-containing protein [Rickettsiaceae bacterium]
MKILLKFIAILVILLSLAMVTLGIWLKTGSATNKIETLITDIVQEELGLNAQIDNLDLSLPLIATIDKLSLSDKNGTAIEIDEFNINILPSLFSLWEINIWSISAGEIRLIRAPQITTKKRKKTNAATSWFNPNIVVQQALFEKITLGTKLTNTEEQIILRLSSYLNFNSTKQILELITSAEIADNSLEVLANIDFKKNSAHIKSIKLESDILTAQGKDVLLGNKLSGEIKYSTNTIERALHQIWPGAKGAASGLIKLAGSMQKPEILASGDIGLKLPENELLKLPPISWSSRLYATNNWDDIDGSISLTQGDIIAKGDIGYSSKKSTLYCKNLQAKAKDFIKTANIDFNLENKILKGTVKATDKTLKESSKFFPFLYSGFLDVTVNYSSPDNKTQHVSLTGTIKQFSSDFGKYGLIDLDINSNDLWNFKLAKSNIDITSFSFNDIDLRSINLNAHTQNDSLMIDGKILAHQPYPVDINFTSSLQSPSENGFVTNIKKLEGKIGKTTISNLNDIIFKYTPNHSLLELLELKIGNGTINLGGDIKHNKVNAYLNLANIRTNALPDILPNEFDNALINGKSNLSGNVLNPVLKADIDIKNISATNENSKPLTLKITSLIKNNKSNFNIKINLVDKNLTTINASLPSKFTLSPFEYTTDDKKQFTANISATSDVDILSLIPTPPGHILSGAINGELKARGTLDSPKINGEMTLNKGDYSYKQYGLELKNIVAKISATDDKINFNNIKANDDFGNQISGNASFSLQKEMPFNIDLTTEKFNLINTPYIHGEINGEITLNGNKEKALAKGVFSLGPLEIKIPEHFQQDIPKLTITKTITAIEKYEELGDAPYELTLDVGIKTGDKVFVRGWGVDALLGGNLHITGPSHNPIVSGLLRIKRGKYQEFGKTLNIKGGALIFDGPITPSPYMNIVATAKEGSADISLVLAGSIQNPDITIESIPAMIEERALSVLLFGENPENISTFQALQLADSLRRLSGKGGGFDPLGLGRKILGVDEISFKSDADDPEKTSVGVGKYLSDKVYFEVEKGNHEGSAKTKIEVQITPKISIENTTEQEGNNSIGINWRFDY